MGEGKIPTWGYSKRSAILFELSDGEDLPKGYYRHPASVPGSEAEKAYKADAEAEGAGTPLVTVKSKDDDDGKTVPPAVNPA